MTFKIVLTCLWVAGVVGVMVRLDEPREPLTVVDLVVQLGISALFIYGIWNWI